MKSHFKAILFLGSIAVVAWLVTSPFNALLPLIRSFKGESRYTPPCHPKPDLRYEPLQVWYASNTREPATKDPNQPEPEPDTLAMAGALQKIVQSLLPQHPQELIESDLLALVASCNLIISRTSLYALGEMAFEFPTSATTVETWAQHPDRNVRLNAIVALSKYGALLGQSGGGDGVLVHSITDGSDGGISAAVREGVRRVGFALVPYIRTFPEIKGILSPENTAKTRSQKSTFARIPAEKIPFLLNVVKANSAVADCRKPVKLHDYTVSRSLEELDRVGPLPPNGIDILAQYLRIRPTEFCAFESAVELLGAQGVQAALAAPDLERLLRETESHDIRYSVAFTLAEIGPKGEEVLTSVAMDERLPWRVRFAAVRGLEHVYTRESWQTLQHFWKSVSTRFPYPYPDKVEIIEAFGVMK